GSASAIASRACAAIERVSGDESAMSTPPVSTNRNRCPFHSATSSLRSRVTPDVSCTTAAREPVKRLTSVDLPTFGNPTIATVPSSGSCSVSLMGSLLHMSGGRGGGKPGGFPHLHRRLARRSQRRARRRVTQRREYVRETWFPSRERAIGERRHDGGVAMRGGPCSCVRTRDSQRRLS